MSPVRTRYGAAAIVVTASRIPQNRLLGMRRVIAMVRALTQTAGVCRRSLRLHRDRNNRPEQRDQQQKSGSNPLHAVWRGRTPKLA